MKALVSVYDKTGLEEFARGLVDLGWELVSSGGTSDALSAAGIDHVEVAELTGAPEMLDGRVKTLHPVVHGGILADRSKPEHLDALDRLGIGLIDLVVCNLYPFPSAPSVELIDVGGPTMVRAAAKNHEHVGVVVDPADYGPVLEELRRDGSLSLDTPAASRTARRSPTPPGTTRRSSRGSTSASLPSGPCRAAWPVPSAPIRPRCCHPPSTSPSITPPRCATARTRTSTVPATASAARTPGGTRSSSTAARSSPI